MIFVLGIGHLINVLDQNPDNSVSEGRSILTNALHKYLDLMHRDIWMVGHMNFKKVCLDVSLWSYKKK